MRRRRPHLALVLVSAVLCAAALVGCADQDSDDSVGDAGVAIDTSSSPSALNACGGSVTLTSAPGDPCGECLDGRLVCDGADALSCHGASIERNACGTCERLPGEPGDPCGCDGTLACDGPRVVCFDDTPRNACGGCAELSSDVGQRCDDEGVVVCTGPNDTTCRSGAANACGVSGVLGAADDVPAGARPGGACGSCGLGTVECELGDPARLEDVIEGLACHH